MSLIKKLIIGSALCCTLAMWGSNASALLIGDSRELGYIEFGIPAGDADLTSYVNHLIDMSVSTTDTALGQDFTRSANDFGTLEDAELVSRTTYGSVGDAVVTIDLGSSGYLYLTAKYDGPNYGTEVWYVGGLTGLITIPSHAGGTSGSQYGISGTALFNGNTSVPDGGSTMLMLGAAMSFLGLAVRRIKG
ncbi:MAG: hypothetical protein K8T26_10235 [Lentisphaerae bacterium]|nr:hypothetical protein [Lentisphaerota bacterium]